MAQQPAFSGSVCKGSFALGTACRSCEKCRYEIGGLRRIAEIVRFTGHEKRIAAGHAGQMGDGGGGAMIAEADAFLAGLDGKLPNGWEQFMREADREADPEYSVYLRLRKKFEG